MRKIIGIFEDYKESKKPSIDFILTDLLSLGFMRENISIISYNFRDSLFSESHGKLDSEKDLEIEENYESSFVTKKDDYFYPSLIMKGSLKGSIWGILLNFLILFIFPDIRNLIIAESFSVWFALSINGLILGFIFGGVLSFLKFESNKIKIMAVVYAEKNSYKQVTDVFAKYNANKITVFKI